MIKAFARWFEERGWRRKIDDAMVRMLAARSQIERERKARQLLDVHRECPFWLVDQLKRERGLK